LKKCQKWDFLSEAFWFLWIFKVRELLEINKDDELGYIVSFAKSVLW